MKIRLWCHLASTGEFNVNQIIFDKEPKELFVSDAHRVNPALEPHHPSTSYRWIHIHCPFFLDVCGLYMHAHTLTHKSKSDPENISWLFVQNTHMDMSAPVEVSAHGARRLFPRNAQSQIMANTFIVNQKMTIYTSHK